MAHCDVHLLAFARDSYDGGHKQKDQTDDHLLYHASYLASVCFRPWAFTTITCSGFRSFFFANAIESRAAFDVMYYLNSVNPGAYLLQTLLLITPLFFLWRQFKYMRLENTYPARNVGFYIVKSDSALPFHGGIRDLRPDRPR